MNLNSRILVLTVNSEPIKTEGGFICSLLLIMLLSLSGLNFSSYKWKTSFPSQPLTQNHFGIWQWAFLSDTTPVTTEVVLAKLWSNLLFNSTIVLKMWSQWHQDKQMAVRFFFLSERARRENSDVAELECRVYFTQLTFINLAIVLHSLFPHSKWREFHNYYY